MKNNHFPYTQFCVKLRQQSLLRHLPPTRHFKYDFSTNDYLGLSQHPLMIQAAIRAADQFGVGSKASRMITTEQSQIKALEKHIAQSKQTQNALVFATGFQANLSVLSALLDPKVLTTTALVFSDKLNHASIYAGCQLAKAKLIRFRHVDYDHLQFLLEKSKSLKIPKLILSESIFGMDGDFADILKLIQLSKDYEAILYIDEAHATGLFGDKGYGLSSNYPGEIDITLGTFSKALGSQGAYLACSHALKRYLINRCSGLIYSTAPSPIQIATMQQAWDLIPQLQPQSQQLLKKAERLRHTLQKKGIQTGLSKSHLIPIILKEAKIALKAQAFLNEKGIHVCAIRPPSVPLKQSRLRIALNIHHSEEALRVLIETLEDFFNF